MYIPFNSRVWQPVFLCIGVPNVGHRRRMEKWGLCVFRRDNRTQTKCPACGFARRFPFAILSWQHQQIIPRHWLSDETHECVIVMLRFIIPFGLCSPQKHFHVGCSNGAWSNRVPVSVFPPTLQSHKHEHHNTEYQHHRGANTAS